jgi:thiol-disulfide isomerase/thioredoxin
MTRRFCYLRIRRAVVASVACGALLVMLPFGQSVVGGAKAPDGKPAPKFDGAVSWLNSEPLSSASLRGKVVLVNFWTYSCINSLRELPYIKHWAAKYKDSGLVVIAVHAPEFTFERERTNVENAVRYLHIAFPVVIDSDHKIWRAFHNEYWPADYFIDGNGQIRYHHFGEGDYEKSERVIQELLRENGANALDTAAATVSGDGAQAPPSRDVRSPETYVGYSRADNFASPQPVSPDTPAFYSLSTRPALNAWGLEGSWTIGAESAVLVRGPGKIAFRFHSRDLHMVLGPPQSGEPVRYRVQLDGAAPGADHGVDSTPDGTGEIQEPRMYQLIRQKGEIRDRTFEIEFLDAGAHAFSFTFG